MIDFVYSIHLNTENTKNIPQWKETEKEKKRSAICSAGPVYTLPRPPGRVPIIKRDSQESPKRKHSQHTNYKTIP